MFCPLYLETHETARLPPGGVSLCIQSHGGVDAGRCPVSEIRASCVSYCDPIDSFGGCYLEANKTSEKGATLPVATVISFA